jgi:trk system potassium uptake protein TrkH
VTPAEAALWTLERSRTGQLRRLLTPARLLLLSFLGLIAAGTLGLRWLPGLYLGEPLSWLDALFTATSAVCVTGLIVVDTATHFTMVGQAFILLLIQLGGLGILTFTTLVILALGRRLSLHHEAVTANTADVAPDVDFRRLVRNIVVFTFLFEAVGALLLFLVWIPRFPAGEAVWHALFQAVSAFCNAGFSTFSDSLMGFQGAPITLGVIMTLIVLGGLGFLTLEELHLRGRKGEEASPRLSLHSRLALAVTAVLLVGGWAAFTTLEWGHTLAEMAGWEKLLNGLFMSVTARTAGFNTVDYAATADSTNFVTILLMSIGGSPGSTAGGIKTTTVAVIGLLAYARLRGHQVTSVQHRSIPEETVQRAVGLFVVGFLVVTGAILLYAIVQLEPVGPGAQGGFLRHMFEAVSAFNTVGLSMGVTGELAGPGKLLTIFLMYVGRVGPLTFASAIALRGPSVRGEFRYAYEDVIIG